VISLNLQSSLVGKMSRFVLVFFLFELLFCDSTCKWSDEINSLVDVRSDVESLQNELIEDLGTKRGQENKRHQQHGKCPRGFTYLPLTGNCYKVVFESHDWFSAGKKCRGLEHGAHLVTITSATENNALKSFLVSELSKNVGNTACIPSVWTPAGNLFWTSGQRLVEKNCRSPFVWKPTCDDQIPLGFTSWLAGEPNCVGNTESCLDLWAVNNFAWNDVDCSLKICPLCEYNP